jgi:hypothetical protein
MGRHRLGRCISRTDDVVRVWTGCGWLRMWSLVNRVIKSTVTRKPSVERLTRDSPTAELFIICIQSFSQC